jgi:quinoprotein glucose dehydrogenase
MEIVSHNHIGPVFTPPSESKIDGPLATLMLGSASGGTNWPGASFDPETHTVYAFACNACLEPIGLVKPPKSISDMNYVAGTAGGPMRNLAGPGENAGADSPKPKPGALPPEYVELNIDRLPMIKPPYRTISVINLDRGEIVWQVPHGDTPDNIRSHPAFRGRAIPRTGQPGYNVGTLVTKTLVIAGAGMVTSTPDHPRGAMLRAYDKQTGKEVGHVYMPAQQSGSPMTYIWKGKQYIVLAISGGAYSGEYIAFTPPEAEAAPTSLSAGGRASTGGPE